MGLVKIGYFRIVSDRSESYVSYDEFRAMDMAARLSLHDRVQSGAVSLFCACRAEGSPLTVSSAGVVRVSSNCRQEDHAESCPKSEGYAGWAAQSKKGLDALATTEDGDGGRICFNFSLPPLFKSPSSPSSSAGSGTGKPREKKMSLLDLVTTVNRIAWLHQTWSVKKKIKEARKAGRDPDWAYKNLEEFNRLFFATTKDVFVRVSGRTVPLYGLCYRSDAFAACESYRTEFFVYAPVERVSEFKASRKYQYVTLRMRSPEGGEKMAVRIPTEDYGELFGGDGDGIRILSGFINKVSFKREDGTVSCWPTLVRGVVIRVTEHGLWYENDAAAGVIRELCDRRVVFFRPYLPLENFGSEIPTVQIDRWKEKTLLIDCPDPAFADAHAGYAGGNEEFDVRIVREGEDGAAAVNAILGASGGNEN